MRDQNYRLSQSVRTTTEAKRLLKSLDQIISSIHSTTDHHENISKALTTSQRQLLLEDLQNNDTTLTEPNAEGIISDIRSSIKEMPVATIELAFQPSAHFTEEVADNINAMTKTPCIVEIKLNPTISGGMVIYFQGRHYDYSLNDKFNEISKV